MDTQDTKIAWVLKLIREMEHVPSKYFKKFVNTNSIWEVRAVLEETPFVFLLFFTVKN